MSNPRLYKDTDWKVVQCAVISNVCRKHAREAEIVRVGENIKTLEQPTEKKFLSSTFHRMW